MEKNLSMEVNEWWNKFDLVEKILIKDTIISLCNKKTSPEKNIRYIAALRGKLIFKE